MTPCHPQCIVLLNPNIVKHHLHVWVDAGKLRRRRRQQHLPLLDTNTSFCGQSSSKTQHTNCSEYCRLSSHIFHVDPLHQEVGGGQLGGRRGGGSAATVGAAVSPGPVLPHHQQVRTISTLSTDSPSYCHVQLGRASLNPPDLCLMSTLLNFEVGGLQFTGTPA